MQLKIIIATITTLLLMNGCDSGSSTPTESTASAQASAHSGNDNPGEENSGEENRGDENAGDESPENGNVAPQPPVQKRAGWYMRTTVKATAADGTVYSHSSAGVFGELEQSMAEKDRHDIPAYGPAALQVVFPHYNWGEESGDYWSDYRKYENGAETRAVWTFQIKNQHTVDLSNADIEIALKDAQNVDFIKKDGNVIYKETEIDSKKREDFTLVDVDKHQTYSVDELEYANLTMDGNHTRTFRWVRGSVQDEDFEPVVLPQ